MGLRRPTSRHILPTGPATGSVYFPPPRMSESRRDIYPRGAVTGSPSILHRQQLQEALARGRWRMRTVKVFVDFWNFQLRWNELMSPPGHQHPQCRIGWRSLPTVLMAELPAVFGPGEQFT